MELKKYYRQYCRNIYRQINHFKNLFLDPSPKLIVLVYHRVLPSAVYDPSDMIISFEIFSAQIISLSKKYPIISLTEAVNQIKMGNFHRDIQIVLTFDDGYRDNYDIVFPYLYKLGIPAAFFVVSDYVEKQERYMNWEQLKKLKAGGMEIGSHGLTHRSLTKLSLDEAIEEIQKSKNAIEKSIGTTCDYFAFPYGSKNDFNVPLIEAVQSAGYKSCLLNIHGYNRMHKDIFLFKRIIVDDIASGQYLLG